MKYITCTNEEGVQVKFEYDFKPFFLQETEGIYGNKNRINREENAGDGSTYEGMAAEERAINIHAQMCDNYQANRDLLYKCFRQHTKGVLRHYEDGITREIEYVVDNLDIGEKGVVRDINVSLLACDPFFKDQDYRTVVMASWAPAFEWTHEFKAEGKETGYRVMELLKEVYNDSTADSCGMKILIEPTGAVNTLTFRNVTTGERITIKATLQPDDVVLINTERGQKDVILRRGEREASINGMLTEDSTFPQLAAGKNVLQYDAVSGKENLNITIEFKQRYIGA